MRVYDFFDYQARERPNADFAIQGDRHVTYREALIEANRLANALLSAGLQIGDRIAVLSKNSIEYAILYFAASKAGVVPVLLNYRLAPTEWLYIINDAQAKLLIAAGEYVKRIDGLRDGLRSVAQYVAFDGIQAAGWDDYRQWITSRPTTPPDRHFSEQADAFQLYTSGTTGQPKGAVITHHAFSQAVCIWTAIDRSGGDERHLLAVPMYHIFGLGWTVLSVYWGGCLCIQKEFNPVETVRALSQEQIGCAPLVPAMIQACLAHAPDSAERRYQKLRAIYYGASAIAERTLRRAVEVFNCDFIQLYGMTETTGTFACLRPSDHRRALTESPQLLLSAGRPVLGNQVRIVDWHDRPVASGAIGEIVVRGPQTMRGYWNRPEESAEALRGGWMHTGDMGMMDDEGYIYVQDRLKDMIVSGGENVYPRVVEAVLFQHPAIADVVVIGVPDKQWGEAVKAVVVLYQGATITEEEIIDFCRDKLGGFERPRSVDFIDALPRNPSGKVLKRRLREPYWAGHERRIGGA